MALGVDGEMERGVQSPSPPPSSASWSPFTCCQHLPPLFFAFTAAACSTHPGLAVALLPVKRSSLRGVCTRAGSELCAVAGNPREEASPLPGQQSPPLWPTLVPEDTQKRPCSAVMNE